MRLGDDLQQPLDPAVIYTEEKREEMGGERRRVEMGGKGRRADKRGG